MLLHHLVDTARIFQARISQNKAIGSELIAPARLGVTSFFLIIAGENPIFETVIFLDQEAEISVILDIFVIDFILGKQIVNDPTKKGNIGTSSDRGVEIGNCCRTGKTRIDNE